MALAAVTAPPSTKNSNISSLILNGNSGVNATTAADYLDLEDLEEFANCFKKQRIKHGMFYLKQFF